MACMEDDFQFPMPSHTSNEEDDLIFFSSIDEATTKWLKNLEDMWALWKKSDGVTASLIDYFETAPNPYLSTLRIVVNTSDFHHIKMKSSLALTVIEEFSKWLDPTEFKSHLSPDLKVAAFKLIMKQKNIQFIKLFAETYEFIADKDNFLRLIMKMVREKQYKEAGQVVSMLQLQEHFVNPEILLLPLIIQNKLGIVEELLANCPMLQKVLVSYLDNLLKPGKGMMVTLDEFIKKNNIPDVQISTVQTRPMVKLVARFIKIYNLPQKLCPNVNKKRSEGALQFLMRKRHSIGDLGTVGWRELVRDEIGNDKKSQTDFIQMLINESDAKEGLYWTREFKIPKEEWPWIISFQAEEEENHGTASNMMNGDDCLLSDDDSINYHELELGRDSIKVVDTARSFEDFLDNGLKGVKIVGIDAEWKPSFGTKQNVLALMQLATKNNVYIMDITTIGNEFPELWAELGLILFENRNILKIGFGIYHDLTVIRDSLPALARIKINGKGYVDIVELWKKLIDDYKFEFPYEGDQRFTSKSLSKLVELCFGQRLNKADQFSNWEQRPLRESQIVYAALDAFCLLEIYTVLEEQSMKLDIPFQDICSEVQQMQHKSPKNNSKQPNRVARNGRLTNHVERGSSLNDKEEAQQDWQQTQSCNYQRNKIQENYKRHPQNKRFQYNKQWKFPPGKQFPQGFQNPKSQWEKNKNQSPRESHESDGDMNLPGISQMQITSVLDEQPRIQAQKWRVVCDSNLGELASRLRMCGCDCSHLLLDQDGTQSARLAMQENRYLLTSNGEYLLKVFVQPGRCYRVRAKTPDEQLLEVLTYFKVHVIRENIFSRCEVCNNNEFVRIRKNVLHELIRRYTKLTQKEYQPRPLLNEFRQVVETFDNPQQARINGNRTWRLNYHDEPLKMELCQTKYFAQVQVEKIPMNILQNVQMFYICEHCGKVYWCGSMAERAIVDLLKNIVFP